MTDNSATALGWERDDGVVTLTLDDPTSSANTMNALYRESMHAAVERLHDERSTLRGVVVTSAKMTFFAGADLNQLRRVTTQTAGTAFDTCQAVKADLRRLETLGKPVVAVLNGTALGGGLEIALACHRRIAVDTPGAVFGLPEVTLGLLPGGGGVTRTVRMFGIADAVTRVLGEGKRFSPHEARQLGLVDEVADSVDAALAAARAWIAANPEAAQPWDRPGYRIPGGTPATPKLAAVLPAFPAMLRKRLKGAPYPAPAAILSAAVEGAQVDFDTASRIESRYLVQLLVGPTAKNMISAFFFDLQTVNGGGSRPSGHPRRPASRVGVLGAGRMGAGIAYSCARAGLDVVLKDVTTQTADSGRASARELLDKAVTRGRLTQAQADQVVGRIVATDRPSDLEGVDVVIEAVFEDPATKQRVFAEVAEYVDPSALLCSNTSTLPITGLAAGVERPADFLGLHFFSPVDKMPLVEIVRGQQTSDAALARAYDLVLQIKKTPIVVRDSRGFFTSRVIGTYVNEGLAMLGEGVHPVSLERAATQAGYPVGPLQLSDELNLELMRSIRLATQAALEEAGGRYLAHPGDPVLDEMLERGRPGRSRGAGFYEYDERGKRLGLWPGLATSFPIADSQPALEEVKDRLLFVEALEAVRCLEEGVLLSIPDANIGSILGIGYPAWTGGALRFVSGYSGGPAGFLARARQLHDRYGNRFAAPELLVAKAARGEEFG